MSVVLGDLGGTNLRLARSDNPSDIKTYQIKDYASFETVLGDFESDITSLFLASAVTPLGGIIEDDRFAKDAHWRIDVNDLSKHMHVTVLNDLEAAAYGLGAIEKKNLPVFLKASAPQTQFYHPPKLIVSIGTGIGHAYIFEKPNMAPFVQRTHGGWITAFGIGAEHQKIMDLMRGKTNIGRDLIMENVVSGHGLWALEKEIGKEDATRLFWEFLGLYCNTLATVAGAYGGLYLTGGIIGDMVLDKTIDVKSFEKFFIRPLASSVVESLSSVPVYYCHDINLPVLGLSEYAKGHR